MCGNGVRTGTAPIHHLLRRIPQDHRLVPNVWHVEAAGTPARGTAGCRAVTLATPTTAASSSVSDLHSEIHNKKAKKQESKNKARIKQSSGGNACVNPITLAAIDGVFNDLNFDDKYYEKDFCYYDTPCWSNDVYFLW